MKYRYTYKVRAGQGVCKQASRQNSGQGYKVSQRVGRSFTGSRSSSSRE